MKILIDADGCPVTKSAIEIGNEFGIESIIFCDTSHQFNIESVTIITVGKGNDSADFALVNKCTARDIVITQDYGLSAMALAKGAIIINQNGLIINDYNIDTLLTSRHIENKHCKESKKSRQAFKRPGKKNKRARRKI